MTWKPIHEAHAIERVKLLVIFADTVPMKLLEKCSHPYISEPHAYGFDTLEPADQNVVGIRIGAGSNILDPTVRQNGWVLKRHEDQEKVEELGLREKVFGYVTTQYGRWANLRERVQGVLFSPLRQVIEAVTVSSVKLEYWDAFVFDGDPSKADASMILSDLDPSFPKHAIGGTSQWHSHYGWFEYDQRVPILINRNLDTLDRVFDDQEGPRRSLNVYTLVEARYEAQQQPTEAELLEDIEMLHRRSVVLFASSIREDYRERIGIRLENYQ